MVLFISIRIGKCFFLPFDGENDSNVIQFLVFPFMYFHLLFSARFFDKVIGKNYEESDLDVRGDIVFHVINQYVRSLLHGCEHLHQSLARLLSLWLDYGSRVAIGATKDKKLHEEMVKCLARMNEIIRKFLERAPSFYFLCVFPQLTSRICHAQPEVWAVLRAILIKTFLAYPHHVFWHMVALSKSSYPQRAKRYFILFSFCFFTATQLPILVRFLNS